MHSSPIRRLAVALSLCGLPLSGLVHAADDVAPDADRFTLRLGALQVDPESRFEGQGTFNGNTYGYDSGTLDTSDKTVPRVELGFRLGDRSRLLFNYLKYDKDRTYVLDQDITLQGQTAPAGSFAKAELGFDLASVMYDGSVVENDNASLGLQIGAEWVQLNATLSGQSGANTVSEGANRNAWAPVVGARLSLNSDDRKWNVQLQAQYLDGDWGDFGDYTGDVTRANALVEYRFTPNVGAFVGYDWFKLNVRREYDDGFLRLDQRFKGPMAGVTFVF